LGCGGRFDRFWTTLEIGDEIVNDFEPSFIIDTGL
jgi:hypothetical protein